ADHEAHRIPRQIDRAFLRLRIPVPRPRLARLADAVGPDENRLLLRLLDLGRGPEMEAGVLRIAVELHRTAGRADDRCELYQPAGGAVVDSHLALFLREDFLLLAVPGDFDALPGQPRARLGRQDLLVRHVSVAGAVPDIGLLAVAVGDLVEAEEHA